MENRHKFEESNIGSKHGNETYSIYCESTQKTSQSSSTELSHDLWKQLKRVCIPVFTVSKSHYENWKAAFTACINKGPAIPEYQLLQLRQYVD